MKKKLVDTKKRALPRAVTKKTAPVKKAPAKKAPVKKTRAAIAKEERDLLFGPSTATREAKKVSPDEAAAFMYLQAYLKTLNKNDAARALLDDTDRQNPAKVYALARRMWKSPVFQTMLDEHLSDFVKKSKQLKRLTIDRAFREMTADHGVGSHQARVRAVEVAAKILGLLDDKKAQKAPAAAQGVLVVPGAISLEDWAASAEAAQEQLRIKTREASKK